METYARVPLVAPTDPKVSATPSSNRFGFTLDAICVSHRALQPKKLVLIPGGHFDPYRDQFSVAEAAATE
jgi:hypothetical protein